VSPLNQAKCLEYLTPLNASILRVRFFSQTSVHSTARFVLHYSVDPPDPKAPCPGLSRSDAWHHVSAVVDVSDPAYAKLGLYLNGSLVASSVGPPQTSPGLAITGDTGLAVGRPDTSRSPPWIGRMFSDDPEDFLQNIHQGEDRLWFGDLDEIRIWDYSLNHQDISSGYNSACARRGGLNESRRGLLVCFDFEDVWEGSGAAGFRDTGAEAGAPLMPVVGDRHTAWCETRGDQGQVMTQISSAIRNTNNIGQSWGFCSDKPRMPGLGFNYSDSALGQFQLQSVKMLPQVPGCGDVSVVFSSNRAEK
jgi:hypothetical protein